MGMVGSRSARFGLLASVAWFVAVATASCGGSNATPPTIYISPAPATPVPGATPTPVPPGPDISSSVISTTAPDSRWTVTFKKPVIGGDSAAVAKMNDAITSKVNDYINAFTSHGLPAVTGNQGPSTLDGDFTIALNSVELISLRFSVLTYVTGAATTVGEAGSINFTVKTGAPIVLSNLFTSSAAALPILTAKTHASLSALLGPDLSWPGGSIPMSFFDKAWVFTPAGLEFSWSQEAIASHAAGMPSATVAWADIKPAIKADGPAGGFVH